MLNEHDTQLVIEHFFGDCQSFWRGSIDDEREVFERALNDTKIEIALEKIAVYKCSVLYYND